MEAAPRRERRRRTGTGIRALSAFPARRAVTGVVKRALYFVASVP
jgi:hypothetical protein